MSNVHSQQLPADGIHGIISGLGAGVGTYANATTRRAQVLTSVDEGKVAIQLDASSLWVVVRAVGGGSYVWGPLCAGPESLTPPGPLTVMAGHIVAGYIPETGLTSTSWADQSGNGNNLAGTCTVQTNQINGYSCAKANGTSDALFKSFAVAAPGTTPQYVYTVVRIDTYANNLGICALGSGGASSVLMHTATDQVSQYNGSGYSNINAAGCTVGSFKLIKAKYTNTTADSIKAGGGAAVTGANNGNTIGGGIYLFNFAGSFAAVSIAEHWFFNSDPGTSLDSYFTTKFPGCET